MMIRTGIQQSQTGIKIDFECSFLASKRYFSFGHNNSIVGLYNPPTSMKSGNKKKQNNSKFGSFMRDIFESFVRKTDSERRAALYGADPFKN